jgi:alpha-L-arabinofuranosidase
VKIEISGSRIRCYLDGNLIHDATVPITQNFYAVTGRDKASGDLVLKAINLGNDAVAAKLNLRGVENIAATAQATVLQAASLADNNSLEQPQRVVPVENAVRGVSENFAHEFPPRSLTVLRLKTK